MYSFDERTEAQMAGLTRGRARIRTPISDPTPCSDHVTQRPPQTGRRTCLPEFPQGSPRQMRLGKCKWS